jgi:hypothetical protein
VYSAGESSCTSISFSFPFSEILGRVELDGADLDVDGTVWVVSDAVTRDDEAIGCLVAVADEVVAGAEPGVGLAVVDVVETIGLVVGALADTDPVEDIAGTRELDEPVVDGITVEVVVRGFTVTGVVVLGLTVSDVATEVGLDAFKVEPSCREGSSCVVRREVAVTGFRSITIEELCVAFTAVVELAERRGGTAGSSEVDAEVARAVVRRAVVVVEVELAGALTVVRAVVAPVVRLTVAASTSSAFTFPLATAVVLLFVALACGSGSETFRTRSISFARMSSSFPASTSTFLAFVIAALAAVRVVRGVATSSALYAERVAMRVGISSAPKSPCLRL